MASLIRIGGDRWSVPPRVNNRFPVRANFGDGVTLFDVRGHTWLPLDSEGFVDVTPGHSYLLYKLTQQEFVEKSAHYIDVHKRKTNDAKRKPSLYHLARGMYYSQVAKDAKQQGRAIGFKELAVSWKNLSKEELEKYQKMAVIKSEELQSEQVHAPTSAASSSSSVSQAPPTIQDGSTKPPKAKKHKSEKAAVATTSAGTESKSIVDMLDPKKKKSLTPKLAPATTSTPAATPSSSQKPKEKHGKAEAKPSTQSTQSQPQKPIAAKAPATTQPAPVNEIRNEFASDSEEEEEETEEDI